MRLGAAARGALVALAALAASVVALACWLLSPAVALALYALYVLLCVLLPWGWLAWRGRGAPRAPLALAPLALAPSLPARLGGRLAEGLTALLWSSPRAVVLSCAALTGAALPLALGVRVEFNIRQLLSPTSELVVGLDKLDEHLTGRGGESSQVVVEGPLARPETLAALERAVLDLRALRSAALVQRGVETRVEGGLVDLWRLERAARPEATLTPALLRRWRDEGAPTSQERPEYTPPEAREVLWAREGAGDGAGAAAGWGVTRLTVQLARTQSSEGIYEAAEALAPAVRRLDEALRALHPEARATLTGGALLRQGELDAVTASMVSSMPIALALCFVITAAAMRSVGRALACVVTLCAVVLWLFALMRLLGYGLNFMSATLGSLAMGVGIDYATHTAMRLDERRAPGGGLSREALAEALGGTGLALCVSALSSVCGFAALTLAPMPLFSSYGLFTAVMVSLALLASLTLLPALLVLPSRLGR